MEKDEYIKRLKDKVLEDAKEVTSSRSVKEAYEELEDLLEAMLAQLKVYKIEFAELQHAAEHKRAEKRGFDNKIYNASVEIKASNPSLRYFRSSLDLYSEIESK